MDEGNNEWKITLGYDAPTKIITKLPTTFAATSLFGNETIETKRTYKLIRLNAEDGKFIKMEIREV